MVSKTALYVSVWVPPFRHLIESTAWLDSLSNFQLCRSSFINGQRQHLKVLCLLSLLGSSTSLQCKMTAMEPWLPRTPFSINMAAMDTRLPQDASSIKIADIELRPPRVLDKMATSTHTDIVLVAGFTTSPVIRHPTWNFPSRSIHPTFGVISKPATRMFSPQHRNPLLTRMGPQ